MIYQNGDILLCSGTSFLSEEIKRVTKSKFSHVGLIFVLNMHDNPTPYVFEAIQTGITIIPLQQYFDNYQQSGKPYAGKLYIGRYKGGLVREEAEKIYQYAVSQVGIKYDGVSIAKQLFNSVFGLNLTDKDDHRLICSEYAGKAYGFTKLELPKDEHGFWTPASIGADKNINIVKVK